MLSNNESGWSAISIAAFSIGCVAVMLLTLTGNALVCTAVCVFPRLRSQPPNLVLLSLALTDLCMVVIMVLNAITNLSGGWKFGITGCHAVASVGLTLSFISILHLCVLSIDRYIAIFKPFRYHSIVKKSHVRIVLPLLWFLPAVVLNLPVADHSFRGEVYNCLERGSERPGSVYTLLMVVLFVFVPFAVIFTTNAKVFQVAFRHARTLSRLEKSLRESRANSEEPEERARRAQEAKLAEFRAVRREIRTAKTFAVVVGVFLLCYIPFFVTGTYRKYAGREAVPKVAIIITTWVAFANSFCNPLVYGLRHAAFRNAFKKLCCCRRNELERRRQKRSALSFEMHSQTCQPDQEAYNTKL